MFPTGNKLLGSRPLFRVSKLWGDASPNWRFCLPSPPRCASYDMLKESVAREEIARCKVLLVDDAAEVLQSLERALSVRFDVATACDAERALVCLEQHGPFAVVVTDHEMPGMKGTEFLAEVHRRFPESVGIMLTGVVELDVAIRALHSGRILRFLEKPCPQEELIAAVLDGVIEHRRKVRARLHEGELEFSRDALWDFNAALTIRIREQTQALHKLNQFPRQT